MNRLRRAWKVATLVPVFLGFGMLKKAVALPTLVRWAWRTPVTASRGDAQQIATLVLRACGLAGVPDRDCLQRSLLMYRELSAAGCDPQLAVGFRRSSDRLEGHAWVTVNGRVIGEPAEGVQGFETAVRFGGRGAPIESAPGPSA